MPIMVNTVEISDDQVHAEMQYHRAQSIEAARDKAARALVIRQLLLQAAKDRNLLNDPDQLDNKKAEETIDRLIQQEVTVPPADEQSCRRYYEQNTNRFIDKRTDQQLPFDRVATQIQNYLQVRSLRSGIYQYIRQLASQARIAGFEL